MDQTSPSGAPRRPSGPELLKEIWHVVQDLPVFLTAPLYRRWHLHWGATAAEAAAELPGDSLVPAAQYCATRAITIDAPASAVWPWLVQVGCLRGGFYSDDLLDNLSRPSAITIIPEFQNLEVGQLVPMAPPGRTSERTAFRVHSFRVNEWLLWSKPDSTWAWSLTPTGTGGTRLVARIRAWYDWRHPLAGLSAALLGPEVPAGPAKVPDARPPGVRMTVPAMDRMWSWLWVGMPVAIYRS